MIWLTWRQHRLWLLVMAALVVAIASLLVYQGQTLNAAYDQVTNGRSVAGCERGDFNVPVVPGPTQAGPAPSVTTGPDAECQQLEQSYQNTYYDPPLEPVLAVVLPILVGLFLGAPLVARELETGTFRLVWTQSVTRTRWLLIKVGAQLTIALLAFAILVPATLYSLGPLGGSGSLDPINFDVEGFVPLAYVAFAFALALATGAVLRTTLPAMFATLVGYVAVRFAIETYARPSFLPPITTIWDPSKGALNSAGNGWTLSVGVVDSAGHRWLVGSSRGARLPCDGPGTDPVTIQCMHSAGLLNLRIWQPSDRFWAFQTIEAALFFVLAAALIGLTVWWLRHRIA